MPDFDTETREGKLLYAALLLLIAKTGAEQTRGRTADEAFSVLEKFVEYLEEQDGGHHE
jgi:hypothetical protein